MVGTRVRSRGRNPGKVIPDVVQGRRITCLLEPGTWVGGEAPRGHAANGDRATVEGRSARSCLIWCHGGQHVETSGLLLSEVVIQGSKVVILGPRLWQWQCQQQTTARRCIERWLG